MSGPSTMRSAAARTATGPRRPSSGGWRLPGGSRKATTTRTPAGSRSTRCPRSTAVEASTRSASSRTKSTGPSAASCRSTAATPAATNSSPASGPAPTGPPGPPGCIPSRLVTTGGSAAPPSSSSCCTRPDPASARATGSNALREASHRPTRTGRPAWATRTAKPATRWVLPMPAGPDTSTRPPPPSTARCHAASSRAVSASRPTRRTRVIAAKTASGRSPSGSSRRPVPGRAGRTADRPGVVPEQLRVLAQHLAVELLQLGSRVEAELLREPLTSPRVHLQGVRLPSRPVERDDELGAEPLVERVRGDERLELTDRLAVPPGRELGVGCRLQGRQPQRFEAGDLGLHPVDVVEVGVRPPPPEPQRVAQVPRRARRVAQPEGLLPGADELLELVSVDAGGWQREAVPVGPRLEPLDQPELGEQAPQVRHVAAQGHLGAARWCVTPQPGDEDGCRHGPVAVEDEQGEQGPLLASGDGAPGAVGGDDLQRAEDVDPPRAGHAEVTRPCRARPPGPRVGSAASQGHDTVLPAPRSRGRGEAGPGPRDHVVPDPPASARRRHPPRTLVPCSRRSARTLQRHGGQGLRPWQASR